MTNRLVKPFEFSKNTHCVECVKIPISLENIFGIALLFVFVKTCEKSVLWFN